MVESRVFISRRSPSISLRGCTTSSRDPLIREQFVHFLYIVQLGLSRYDQEMERLPSIFGIAGNPSSLVLEYLH